MTFKLEKPTVEVTPITSV